MTIKKKYLELVNKILHNTSLNLADARIRDAFLRQSDQFVADMLLDREKICIEYCDKKEDGSPDITNGNRYMFTTRRDEFTEELKKLSEEELTIDIPENHIEPIKRFIEQTTYMPLVGETEYIDEIIAEIK